MNEELDALDARISHLAALARRLHAENATLRTQLEAAKADGAQLREKMAEARGRVESALARLPGAPQEAALEPDAS